MSTTQKSSTSPKRRGQSPKRRCQSPIRQRQSPTRQVLSPTRQSPTRKVHSPTSQSPTRQSQHVEVPIDQIAGKGASKKLRLFVTCFLPFAVRTVNSRTIRRREWPKVDLSRNGRISLSDIKLWVLMKLESNYGAQKGKNIFHLFHPVYLYTFRDVIVTAKKAAASPSSGSSSSSSTTSCEFITPSTFRLFLAHLCVNALMYDAFTKMIDHGIGESQRSGDSDEKGKRIISLEEWKAGYKSVTSHGFLALSKLSSNDSPPDEDKAASAAKVEKSAMDLFAKMDSNNSGFILYNQWCVVLKRAEIDEDTHIGYLLNISDLAVETPEVVQIRTSPKVAKQKLTKTENAKNARDITGGVIEEEVCKYCGMEAEFVPGGMRRCGWCYKAKYCSKDCLQSDWASGGHKDDCEGYHRHQQQEEKEEKEKIQRELEAAERSRLEEEEHLVQLAALEAKRRRLEEEEAEHRRRKEEEEKRRRKEEEEAEHRRRKDEEEKRRRKEDEERMRREAEEERLLQEEEKKCREAEEAENRRLELQEKMRSRARADLQRQHEKRQRRAEEEQRRDETEEDERQRKEEQEAEQRRLSERARREAEETARRKRFEADEAERRRREEGEIILRRLEEQMQLVIEEEEEYIRWLKEYQWRKESQARMIAGDRILVDHSYRSINSKKKKQKLAHAQQSETIEVNDDEVVAIIKDYTKRRNYKVAREGKEDDKWRKWTLLALLIFFIVAQIRSAFTNNKVPSDHTRSQPSLSVASIGNLQQNNPGPLLHKETYFSNPMLSTATDSQPTNVPIGLLQKHKVDLNKSTGDGKVPIEDRDDAGKGGSLHPNATEVQYTASEVFGATHTMTDDRDNRPMKKSMGYLNLRSSKSTTVLPRENLREFRANGDDSCQPNEGTCGGGGSAFFNTQNTTTFIGKSLFFSSDKGRFDSSTIPGNSSASLHDVIMPSAEQTLAKEVHGTFVVYHDDVELWHNAMFKKQQRPQPSSRGFRKRLKKKMFSMLLPVVSHVFREASTSHTHLMLQRLFPNASSG